MLDTIKLAAVLTLVTFAAGLAIAITNARTAERIEEQAKLAERSALTAVFPEGVDIVEKSGSATLPARYWVASKDGDVVGYAFQDSSRGFEKDIRVMVGVAPSGTILGMSVLSQSETPGLGTRTQEVASKKYIWNAFSGTKGPELPWFTQQFTGIDVLREIGIDKAAEWHGLNDEARGKLRQSNSITAITGATISTRAVIKAVTRNIPGYLAYLRPAAQSGDK